MIHIYYPSLGQTLNDTALAQLVERSQLVEFRSIVVDINFVKLWSLVRIRFARAVKDPGKTGRAKEYILP